MKYNRNSKENELSINDITRVKLRCSRPLIVNFSREYRNKGSIILIDVATKENVAAGMVIGV